MSQEQYIEELIKQTENYLHDKETEKENVWQYTVDKMDKVAKQYSMDHVDLLDDIAKMFMDKVRELRNTN